ncbi:MAG: hypothetical protein ACTSXW_03095 [Candidatus Baldrarchaeia archaeon]
MKEVKVKRENDKIVGFLKLLDGSTIDLSFDRSSGTVLMSFKDIVSRMNFEEFKEFVKALENYIKHIENVEEGI